MSPHRPHPRRRRRSTPRGRLELPGLKGTMSRKLELTGLKGTVSRKLEFPGLRETMSRKLELPGLKGTMSRKLELPGPKGTMSQTLSGEHIKFFYRSFFASGVSFPGDFLHYNTMILQLIRIIVNWCIHTRTIVEQCAHYPFPLLVNILWKLVVYVQQQHCHVVLA